MYGIYISYEGWIQSRQETEHCEEYSSFCVSLSLPIPFPLPSNYDPAFCVCNFIFSIIALPFPWISEQRISFL